MSQSTGFPATLSKILTRSTVPLGAARTLVGAVVLAHPTLMASALGVDAVTAQRTAWIARFFASRDLSLGIGAVRGNRGCQAAACISDVSDVVAIIVAIRGRHVKMARGLLVAATAAGAAAAGAATLLTTRE